MPSKNKPKLPVKVFRDDWKGLPLLKFEGSFRPFRLGFNKCEAILEALDQIKAFVEEQREWKRCRLTGEATPEEKAIIAKYIPNPH